MAPEGKRAVWPILKVYQAILGTGFLSTRFGRWLFNAAYTLYKQIVEAPYTNTLLQVIPRGSTVVDVGANIGFFTLRFARQVGPRGRVIAIEPEGLNFATLSRQVTRAGFADRVDLRQMALADRSAQLHLKIDPVHPANHQLSENGIPVQATTLDSLLEGFGNPAVALIKIDVQGAEKKVLLGALRTLERCYPALFVEIHEKGLQEFQSSAQDVINFLTGYGYEIYQLSRTFLQGPLSVQQVLEQQAKLEYADYLFVHSSANRVLHERSGSY